MTTDVLAAAFDDPDWRLNGTAPKDGYSLIQLVDRVRTEADAYRFLEEMRWGGDPQVCPHCGSTSGAYFLKSKDPEGRKTRGGGTAKSQRRVWKCKDRDCRKQFSVLTHTPFHGMKIPVRKLVFVVFELCSSKNGVSAREIERKYDLTPKSAWFLLMRIREGMGSDAPFWTDTAVVADETYIGGRVNKMNAKRKAKHAEENPSPTGGPYGRAGGTGGKTPVVTLINRQTGEAYSRVVNDVNRRNLRDAITDVADVPNVDIHTDRLAAYTQIGKEARSHERADHGRGEYVTPNGGGTNQAESYFAQLKRSIDGTHHHVSSVHLPMYLKEFDFRHNTHRIPDSQRMQVFYGQLHGKRITYKPSSVQP